MTFRVTPMIHVPDVGMTIEWYKNAGFTVEATNDCDGIVDWALLSFGEGRVMFNASGRGSTAERREVDLYLHTEDVAAVYERLKGRVDLHKELHDTFYGMREFIVRDLNGFWVTFGQNIK